MGEERIPYYDPAWAHRLGVRSKKAIHDEGLPHRSTIILVESVREEILVVTRPDGSHDFVGGHEDEADRSSFQNAYREAREEVILEPHRWRPVSWQPTWFSEITTMVSEAPHNREQSTVYILRLPQDWNVVTKEEVGGRTVEVIHRWMPLEEIFATYKADPSWAADGLSRVLDRVMTDGNVRERLGGLLPPRRLWRATFACRPEPDEPGCGCPDELFTRDEVFGGTYDVAEAEARCFNSVELLGDFHIWLRADE